MSNSPREGVGMVAAAELATRDGSIEAQKARLDACTRYTQGEIDEMYEHAGTITDSDSDGSTIGRAHFMDLCHTCGLESQGLKGRLWDVLDQDDDDKVTLEELVMLLNAMARGTLKDVTLVFFKMYDINHDGSITIEEFLQVFEELLAASKGVEEAKLSDAQREECVRFFHKADADSSQDLDYEEFASVVQELADSSRVAPSFLTCTNLWLMFVTAFFEIGTSFGAQAAGGLALQLQKRMDTDDAGIGTLVAMYFAGAMLGPITFGGPMLMKVGACRTLIVANVFVTAGVILQTVADGADQFWILCVGRFLIGYGGMTTPFCALEVLLTLYPHHFMFMAGIRNLIQSGAGFLAFIILPGIHAMYANDGDPEVVLHMNRSSPGFDAYNEGTTWAMAFCIWASIASLLSSAYVYLAYLKSDDLPQPKTLASQLRGWAGAITPRSPSSLAQFKLPISFYLSIFGIQAQYFAPFAFVAYSNMIYVNRFGQTAGMAAFFSGFMNILGGMLGPILGPVSDMIGQRAISLSLFGLFTIAGFVIIATTTMTPWVPTILFALTYGFGDTVAYPNIRLLVGAERAGIGYGVAGLIGYGTTIGVMQGANWAHSLDDKSKPMESGVHVAWYFAAMSLLGTVLWAAVHFIEGPKSAISLPACMLIETSDADINAAALTALAQKPDELALGRTRSRRGTAGDGVGRT